MSQDFIQQAKQETLEEDSQPSYNGSYNIQEINESYSNVEYNSTVSEVTSASHSDGHAREESNSWVHGNSSEPGNCMFIFNLNSDEIL
jgi:hypothetical protein